MVSQDMALLVYSWGATESIFSSHFFHFSEIIFIFIVAMRNLVHAVETLHVLC